ncbi:MAG: fused MFS/spermidine synthase, partial [Burkholderiales bacterium]
MSPCLNFATALQPGTFDLSTFRTDASLGFQPSTLFALYGVVMPGFKALLVVVYHGLTAVFPFIYAMQLNSPRAPAANFIKIWVVGILACYFTYFLYPVAGPIYAFGDKAFPAFLPALEFLQQGVTIIAPAPRNAMPSMHFGWALLFWMNAGLLPNPNHAKWLRAFAAVVVALTGLATLTLGEHYLVDLVVAVPFVIALQALCTDALPWSNVAKRNSVVIGFGVALAWMLGLRFGAHAFINIQGLTWVAIIITLAVSVGLYRPLARHSRAACENAPPMPLTSPEPVNIAGEASGSKKEVRLAGLMFILSGFAGIMYEVLFSKALALTFGSTSTAAYTVLATYMGGMAIGSWLGGRVASGHAQPLRLYAYCELAIAVYCAATPMIFKGMQGVYVGIASGVSPDAQILTVFRLALGIGALLVPTILMGMTLPILARFFESRSHSLGRSVAVLYGANTLGAALGALMAGYFVLPTLGVQRTTLAAAAINMFVALMAMQLQKKILAKPQASNIHAGEARTFTPPQIPLQLDGTQAKWLGNLALVILGVGGIVTLAIEIKYFHMLSVVAGNSTYAFSLMLFTFLLGLGAGAEVARRLLQRRLPLRLLLGWLEFGLAAVILGGVFLWSKMPDYFGRFGAYPMVREFGSREIVRGVVCWLAMFPPALFIGAIYPVAMECIGRAHAANPIQALGRAAAFNTLGNIAGVILGAFILLPHLGALHSIQLLAVVCMILGTVTLWRERGTTRIYRWAPAALAALLLLAQPNSFDYDKLATGSNVYFFPQAWGRVIDHAESVDGGLTSVAVQEFKDHPPIRTLLTNGKFQGNDANTGEMQAQLGIALSSLLHTSHRESALAIGYGTGVSARTLHEAGFKQLDVVDLSADILRMANKHFASVNDRVTEKAGVSTYVTDGRNFLMLQERRYDLIGMEISSIWFAGAASLYNQEFYKLVKK